ncbi:hypothetical protein [Deinococcus frigens]|uniref:hypothetical protein n=1 Tax=Deinococcus frigens TaxID=249403 RepID=UPI00068EADE2|nr:hypothetical protein [Deinococcus frigens]
MKPPRRLLPRHRQHPRRQVRAHHPPARAHRIGQRQGQRAGAAHHVQQRFIRLRPKTPGQIQRRQRQKAHVVIVRREGVEQPDILRGAFVWVHGGSSLILAVALEHLSKEWLTFDRTKWVNFAGYVGLAQLRRREWKHREFPFPVL